jgi:hypothetical protein
MARMLPGKRETVHDPNFERPSRRPGGLSSLEAWRYAIEEGAPFGESMDEAAREAPGRAAWQCAAGCAACCHLMVQVTPAEVEALVPHVTGGVAERLRANAALVSGMDAGAYRRARPRCAFLDDAGLCSVYDVRPVRCRSHVSSDVATCLRVLGGEESSGAVPGDPWLRSVASAVQAGLGVEPRELHQAVCARLDR